MNNEHNILNMCNLTNSVAYCLAVSPRNTAVNKSVNTNKQNKIHCDRCCCMKLKTYNPIGVS